MSKQSLSFGVPIVWLCTLALLLGLGCASSGRKAEDELRLRRANSHFNLGLDYIRNDRIALAIRELLFAEELDPKNPRIHQALADAYVMRGKPVEAEQHYLLTLKIDPTIHEARLNLSSLYNQLDRYEESLVYASMLADDATFSGPWRALANKGFAEYQLGRVEEARNSLRLALEYRSDYWPTLLYLGILEMEEGRQREAIGLFQQVLELDPALAIQAQANYRIGEIYIALGKRQRAIGHLQAAVAQTPGGPWGVRSEEYLKLLR
ncbi:MAG: tetratricopeptide repeat protein [Deltaproteobacteria bacterium]|jgi:Tfp pilus assembly protein PilF|nr:tetratricopeptide repeat protein [Deltaproteobacteria bacterium]